jgi:hypothetical protein
LRATSPQPRCGFETRCALRQAVPAIRQVRSFFVRGRRAGRHAARAKRAGGIHRGLFERQMLEFNRSAAAG